MRHGFIALLGLVLVQGCASTTEINTRYLTDTAVAPAPSVLLVGRTPETDMRARWENACAEVLEGRRLTVIRSHEALPLWYEAGNDRLLNWAREHNVDSLLIAEITGLLLAPQQLPTQSYMQSERNVGAPPVGTPTWSFWFGGGNKSTQAPTEIHEIEFQLLDRDGKTRWNGVGFTHEANELEAIARSQCQALQKSLTGLRLLP